MAGIRGDKSVFGLNAAQVVDVVDKLKQVDALDCLKLLHYHQGPRFQIFPWCARG